MTLQLMPDLQEAIQLSRFWTDFEPSEGEGEQQRMVSCILLAYIDLLEQEIERLRALYPEDATDHPLVQPARAVLR